MPMLAEMKIAENNLKCEGRDCGITIPEENVYWIVKGKNICPCCKAEHERGRGIV